jgi:Raf kinase inhibitor-like YbhB/YbcL family protein
MRIHSDNFAHEGPIPAVHTCEGRDRSPHLAWSDVPDGARSLVLIVDDPDAPNPAAPRMTWVHWVLYNIPTGTHELPEGIAPADLPLEVKQAINSWDRTGYGGPCPPVGRHRYFHKLYALDVELPNLGVAGKDEVVAAMEGHVLAQAVLIGTYEKQR